MREELRCPKVRDPLGRIASCIAILWSRSGYELSKDQRLSKVDTLTEDLEAHDRRVVSQKCSSTRTPIFTHNSTPAMQS